jgi:prephenate dehydratase
VWSPRIAFQGEAGAFGHLASRVRWGHDVAVVPCATFDDVCVAVVVRHAEYAVLPVENCIAGIVHEAVLAHARQARALRTVSELVITIELALMAPAGATLDTVRRVSSHPVALAQCSAFFRAHPMLTAVREVDTGAAARMVSDAGDATGAAVASAMAADWYGLTILLPNVADRADNWTRFVVVEASAHDER